MKSTTVVSFFAAQLSLAAASTIPAGLSKRASVSNGTLIAYGTDTEGWPVAYGLDDGELICIVLICVKLDLKLKLCTLFSETLHHSQP